MKITEPKTPSRCSASTSAAADPAIVSAAAATAHATSAPAASARAGKTEVGFTLQTLIVMAVFVLAAVGVGIGLLAVNSATSDDFEEAGQTGVEARCAPNEVKDPELEARGVAGVNQTYREIVSDTIGCNPVCGTWEYYNPGRAAEGIGGPDGNGGIFSTSQGCFAPCYWSYTNATVGRPAAPGGVINSGTSLQYADNNDPPRILQVRLGVNYRRSPQDPSTDLYPGAPSGSGSRWRSDLQPSNFSRNEDGKPFIVGDRSRGHSSAIAPGTPLTPALLQWVPAVFEPNWRSRNADPGLTDPTQRNGTAWEDENWEVRADPYNKVCTIVNITLDDQVVCSSEWDSCEP